MLKKFLKVHKLNPFPRPKPTSAEGKDNFSAVLKIVHAGGNVECYYMATPAARIMKKYPKFLLARPEVFRRPWDSVVRPDEILTPGQKFFVVPRRTVRKLRKRIRRPKICVNSFMSDSDNSSEIMSLEKKDGFLSDSSITSSCFSASRKKFSGKTKKHVSFYGIDVKQKVITSRGEKKGKEGNTSISRKSLNPQPLPHREKRRVRNAVTWQPSLTAISESLGSEE